MDEANSFAVKPVHCNMHFPVRRISRSYGFSGFSGSTCVAFPILIVDPNRL